jgi:hypothetical protein
MSASLEKTFQLIREPVAAPKRVNICPLGPGPPPNVDARPGLPLRVFFYVLSPLVVLLEYTLPGYSRGNEL